MGSWQSEHLIEESRDVNNKPLVQKVLRMRKHGRTGYQVHLVTRVFDEHGDILTDIVQLTGRQMDEVNARWEDFKGVH